MEKRYPFPFLDAYRREDFDFFFGRTEEIETLYKLSLQANIVLVYGTSGTGKTSLIQCGLASKFQSYDWLALNVRRGKNIISSLDKVLCDESDGEFVFEEKENPVLAGLARKMEAVYKASFKPLYLIFDQFEELYILGSKTEQQQFIDTVREILRVEQPVKIILSIREEYLGHLYEFERQVPELLRKKLRVEPMNLDKVKTVIQGVGSLPQSNVRLRGGEEEAIAIGVFEKIRGENQAHIPLPYLQVFLDKYYLHTTGDEDHRQEAILTLATLEGMGDIGDVLRDFLDEQVLKIAQALQQKPETIWHTLSPFVTLEGTKEPLPAAALYRSLPDTDPALIDGVVQELVTRRILRFTEHDQLYEIAHDSLAKQVHDKRSDEEIAILEVKRLIRSQVSLNPDAREFFTEKQLLFIEPYLAKFHPSDEEQDWIDKSWADVRAQQEAEERRQREELERVQRQAEQERKLREQAETNEKRARQRTRLAALVSIIALCLALFAGWSYLQANEAKEAASKSAKEASEQREEAIRQKADAEAARIIADSNATVALQKTKEAEDALALADQNLRKAQEEEARATAALEQVNKEKAATEEQRKKAEESARIAEDRRQEAESLRDQAQQALDKATQEKLRADAERDKAQTALDNLEKKNADVVRLILQNAERDIYTLRYEDALEKMKAAASLGALKPEVTKAWLEIAFWLGEVGNTQRATVLLDSAAALVNKPVTILQPFRESIRAFDPTEYKKLMERYYPVMVDVEGGVFDMGCDPGDSCEDLHKQEVSSFQMAKYETSWWQYFLFCKATGHEYVSPGWGTDGDNPVVNVSWFDAVLYANWVNKQQGREETYLLENKQEGNFGDYYDVTIQKDKGFRLPTEAQWEYAAKGGIHHSPFIYSGDSVLVTVGWFRENSGSRTRSVEEKKANALGLYHMSGNAWEWCWDWYGGYPENPGKDYEGPKEEGSGRVLRGGSWNFSAGICRVADRDGSYPDSRYFNGGFRLVFVP